MSTKLWCDDNYVQQLNLRSDSESLSDAAQRCFPIDSTWSTLSVLKDGLHKFSSMWGFQIVRNAMKLCCSRYGCCVSVKAKKGSNVPLEKQRVRGSVLKSGCTFCIKFRITKFNGVVVIYGACYDHLVSGGCVPSPANLVFVRRTGGHYAKLQIDAMKKLLSFYEMDNVSPKVLRKLLKDFLPANVPIDAQFLVNMRLKAKVLLPKWKANGMIMPEDVNGKVDYIGLDDMEELYHDKASVEARKLLYEVLQVDGESVSIERYLQELKQLDLAFEYRIAKDDSGVLLGAIWQTPAMRGMFKDYGEVLFTDVMKREMNNIRWPYISLTVLDSMCSIHVVVEGLICGEYLDAYSWVIKSAFEMTPMKTRDTVRVIYADQFLTETALTKAGFVSPPLLAFDYWHLLDSALPKKFGRQCFLQLKEHLCSMMNANNVKEFDNAVSEATFLLCNDPQKMTKLKEFAALRKKYAKFELWRHPGSLQRRGSVVAEQNHASYIARIGPLLTVSPSVAICEMIERQKDIVKEKNLRLTKYKFKVNSVIMNRKNGIGSCALQERDVIFRDGFSYLSEWGFQLFSKEVQQFNEYVCCQDKNCSSEYLIHRVSKGLDSARHLNINCRCDCDSRVSFGIMCRHELVLHKRFIFEMFESRWKLVDQVRLSKGLHVFSAGIEEASIPALPPFNATEVHVDGSLLQIGTPMSAGSTRNFPFVSAMEQMCTPTQGVSGDSPSVTLTSGDLLFSHTRSINKTEQCTVKPTHKDFVDVVSNVYSQCQHNQEMCTLAFGALVEIHNCLLSGEVDRQRGCLQQYATNTLDFFSRFNVRQDDNTSNYSSGNTKVATVEPLAIPNTHRPSWSRILSPGETSDKSRKSRSVKRKLPFETSTVGDVQLASYAKKKSCCSFCHKPGHVNSKLSPCDLLLSWGTVMEKEVNKIHSSASRNAYYMSHDEYIGDVLQSLCIVTMKHIVVHKFVVKALADRASSIVNDVNELFACITPLSDIPEDVVEFKNRLVSLPTLCSWISKSSKNSIVVDGRTKVNHTCLVKWCHQAAPQTISEVTFAGASFNSDNNEISLHTVNQQHVSTLRSDDCSSNDEENNKKLSGTHCYMDNKSSVEQQVGATFNSDVLTTAEGELHPDSCHHLETLSHEKNRRTSWWGDNNRVTSTKDDKSTPIHFRVGDTVRYSYMHCVWQKHTLMQGVIKEIKTDAEILDDDSEMIILTNCHPLGYIDMVSKVNNDIDGEGPTSCSRWVYLADYDDERLKDFVLFPGKLEDANYSGGLGSFTKSFNKFVVEEWEKF